MKIEIRTETESDYFITECVIRDAFWNLYQPGCSEHILARKIRSHPDGKANLNFVITVDEEIVGSIFFTKSKLTNANKLSVDSVTLGPVCIHPRLQRKGLGKKLIEYALEKAIEVDEEIVVIQGYPHHYIPLGFKDCKSLGIMNHDGRYPFGLLGKELVPGVLGGETWCYQESTIFSEEIEDLDQLDQVYPAKEKSWATSQELFSLTIQAYLD